MRAPVRILPVVAVLTAALPLAACGGSSGGTGCSGAVCTIQSDGPETYDLDQLGTKVTLSDLRADAVTVRINAEQAVVPRDADPVRIRGFLVTAPKTGTDHVEVRIQR